MKVAMMQPSFLPWQGFFELVYQAERFIILDDFQFSVQSYHQRNRLFVNKGQIDWYSVPIQKSKSYGKPLNDTLINEVSSWRVKMWKRIQQNYSKAEYYPLIAPLVQEWLLEKKDSLAAENIAFIKLVCELLGLSTEVLLSSDFTTYSQRSERVASLLELSGAGIYYCAKGSFEYMFSDGLFPLKDIEILFQDFHPRPYRQIGAINGFIPYLSVLDALLNVGPEGTMELIAEGTPKWLSWAEMATQKKESLQVFEET